MPDFSLEHAIWNAGAARIAGIDEAGRGPWAGPVVAAAVVLSADAALPGLDDSKKMTAAARERLFEAIQTSAEVGVGQACVAEIDQMNILAATLLAMRRALDALAQPVDAALVDGNRLPDLPCPAQAVVKGDGRSLSIAAASVIAKVTRDRIMADLAQDFPAYGWERNAGYGTKAHQDALARVGITPHHRKSFKPIAKILSPG
ncbi:MAG: ribonuclease HII [Magnetospiraceae bacterium]